MVYFWRLWSTFAYTSWLWSIISPERNIHFWSNKKYLKEKTLHIFMIALSHFHWGSNNSPFSDPRPPLKPMRTTDWLSLLMGYSIRNPYTPCERLTVSFPQGVYDWHFEQFHLKFTLYLGNILVLNKPQTVYTFHVDVSSGPFHLKLILPVWKVICKSSWRGGMDF